jgi:hypothetical protein
VFRHTNAVGWQACLLRGPMVFYIVLARVKMPSNCRKSTAKAALRCPSGDGDLPQVSTAMLDVSNNAPHIACNHAMLDQAQALSCMLFGKVTTYD